MSVFTRSNLKSTTTKKEKESTGSTVGSSSSSTTQKRLQPCLNPKCSKKHFLQDSPISSPEEVKKLLEAMRAEARRVKLESRIASTAEKADDKGSRARTQAPSLSSEQTCAKPALVMAEVSGFKCSCLIDSGADEVPVSDTIIQFLGDKGTFLWTMQLRKAKTFKAVDGTSLKSPGMVQLCPTRKTVAGPCRLRNIKANIMPCTDTTLASVADCADEIVLENAFVVHSGLDVTDFLAKNIDDLSTLDYGSLHSGNASIKVGKLGVCILTEQSSTSNIDVSNIPSRFCNIVMNVGFSLA